MHLPLKSVWLGYIFRLLLTAIHFNENSDREQARSLDGELKWQISYPKAKKGEPVAKQVKVQCTYGECKLYCFCYESSCTNNILSYSHLSGYIFVCQSVVPSSLNLMIENVEASVLDFTDVTLCL